MSTLFRNFLLANRIFKSLDRTTISVPALPDTSKHVMWDSWDYAVESTLLLLHKQLKTSNDNPDSVLASSSSVTTNSSSHPCSNSKRVNLNINDSFFKQHLQAFKTWLEVGIEQSLQPLHLPIVLQALLSQSHRTQAISLLANFMGKGTWAVNMALSVGVFPYMLRLLGSPAPELREKIVVIWTRILAVSASSRSALTNTDTYLRCFLAHAAASTTSAPQKILALYVLAACIHERPKAQEILLACTLPSTHCNSNNTVQKQDHQQKSSPTDFKANTTNIIQILAVLLRSPDASVRRWACLLSYSLWKGCLAAKVLAASVGLPDDIARVMQDPEPTVRAACVLALGYACSFPDHAGGRGWRGGGSRR